MKTELAELLTMISPANLSVARDSARATYPGGRSPYKPLLLLAVFACVNQQRPNFYKGWFRPSDAIGPFTYLHMNIFPDEDHSPRRISGRFAQPYWYLGTGNPRVWELRPRRGSEAELRRSETERVQIKTISKLEQIVEYAVLPPTTVKLAMDFASYKSIESYLIVNYFDANREVTRIVESIPQ